MTFEQVQQNLGYGGQTPTLYGGTGLSSEQSFQHYSGMSSGQRHKTNVPIKTSLNQSPPKTTMASHDAPNLVYQSPQPAAPNQPAMTGQSVKYQSQNQQPQPVLAYSDPVDRHMTDTATSVNSEQQIQSQQVQYSDIRRPDMAVAVSPSRTSGGDRTMSAAGALKTWDFVVLAQSRLHRLQDQTVDEVRGQNEAMGLPQADVVQPYAGPQSTSSASGGNYGGNQPMYPTVTGQPIGVTQINTQPHYGGRKEIQGQTAG